MLNKGKTKSFSIDYMSEIDQFQYQGAFTSKKMSIMDQTRVSRRRSELCGGMYCVRDEDGNPTGQGIDEWAEVQSRMIAILEVALVQKPAWWDLAEIGDEELLGKVFEEVMLFENTFRKFGGEDTTSGDSSASSEGDGEGQCKEPVLDNHASKVVDGQVSASLDA